MSRLLSFLLWCLPIPAIAAPATSAPPAGNRFLFVVDTSSAMRQFKHEGRQLVFDLIFSGFHGQLRPGDTYGIWTFNREVSAGVFPMQVWQPDNALDLANTAALFLKEQSYQKSARLGQVFAQVVPLIANVKDVQVLIVTSGQSELSETNVIQDFWLAWQSKAEAARKAKSPLVIALGARNGKITTWSFAIGDEPIELPKPPIQIVAATSPATTNSPEVSPSPTIVAANMLVSPQPDATAQPAAQPKPPVKPPPAPIIIQRNRPDPATNSAPPSPQNNDLASGPKVREERRGEDEAASAPAPIPQTDLPKSLEDRQPLPDQRGEPLPRAAEEGGIDGGKRIMNAAVSSVTTNLPAPAVVQARNSQATQPAASAEQSPALPTAAVTLPPAPSKRLWLFWGGGLGLLAGAGGVMFRYFLRPRQRTSFITQSMNRES